MSARIIIYGIVASLLTTCNQAPGKQEGEKKEEPKLRFQQVLIADSIPACHTLQVFDFDLDGDFDVLAGINKSRAVNLGITSFAVTIFMSDSNYRKWTPMVIEGNGIYNGQIADFDQDGDWDIFRYPSHDSLRIYLLKNQVIE